MLGVPRSLETIAHAAESVDLNIGEKKCLCCRKEKGNDFQGVESEKTVAYF